MIQAFRSRQFVLFLFTGGVAAAANFCSRIVLSVWLNYSTAIILAYLVGMITAFVLARLFVFSESQQPIYHSALFFVLVNIFAVLQTWLVSIVLAIHLLPWLGVVRFTQEIAHAIGVVVPVFSSYIGHKRFSFR